LLQLEVESVQEFRAELQAAETKDKKYLKRKTVLKKIVANITMGNDSQLVSICPGRELSFPSPIVSPLFTDVVQCLGTPLLEIKKSVCTLLALSVAKYSYIGLKWSTCSS
jgi:hypothetical protein